MAAGRACSSARSRRVDRREHRAAAAATGGRHRAGSARKRSGEARDAGIARAQKAVASERYRRLVLDTALWSTAGAWSRSTAQRVAQQRAYEAAADFAAREFARRQRKLAKKTKQFTKLDPRQRHKRRIAAKKLRYADEFFASFYDRGGAKRRVKQHDKALKALQSALGKLNDMRVHKQMTGKLMHTPRLRKKPEESFALGLIAGEDHAQEKALLAAAAKAAKKLAAVKPYWD